MYAYVASTNIKQKLSAQNKDYSVSMKYFTNGTVKLQWEPIEEKINIRLLIPFEGNV